tara:strand:+ start:246 stop:773 length:528 start_codon:yes stop_codon:yes gene_type:complete
LSRIYDAIFTPNASPPPTDHEIRQDAIEQYAVAVEKLKTELDEYHKIQCMFTSVNNQVKNAANAAFDLAITQEDNEMKKVGNQLVDLEPYKSDAKNTQTIFTTACQEAQISDYDISQESTARENVIQAIQGMVNKRTDVKQYSRFGLWSTPSILKKADQDEAQLRDRLIGKKPKQ